MFFRRRSRNRRHDRRFAVLDVRLRVAPARRSRWRTITLALALAALATFGLFLAGRLWHKAQSELVGENPFFALKTIEITTESHWLTPEQVQKWVGVQLGDNLLTLDIARIKHDLEIIPQIESVSVERVLPHLLRLHVSEREPVAQVRSVQMEENTVAPVVYYLDATGVVLPPQTAESVSSPDARALAALPAILGLTGRELRPGQRITTPALQGALALLAEFPRSPMAGLVDLASIDIVDPAVLALTTSQGAVVTLAQGDFSQQLRRWHAVHAYGLQIPKAVASLDLSVTNNCPVLWVETNSLPPKPAKPVKLSRVQRKHA